MFNNQLMITPYRAQERRIIIKNIVNRWCWNRNKENAERQNKRLKSGKEKGAKQVICNSEEIQEMLLNKVITLQSCLDCPRREYYRKLYNKYLILSISFIFIIFCFS